MTVIKVGNRGFARDNGGNWRTFDGILFGSFKIRPEREGALLDEIERLQLAQELAWGLIANAYGGDWDLAPEVSGWKKAAEKWRDAYCPVSGDTEELDSEALADNR